jgi:hypothetical protein
LELFGWEREDEGDGGDEMGDVGIELAISFEEE